MRNYIIVALSAIFLATGFTSCKKDYYFDTGVHNAKFDGSIIQYLKTKPALFDTTLMVIKLAGMEDILDKENVTFFAPTNSSIVKSVRFVNRYLKANGNDTIVNYSQVKPAVWRKMLARYVFKGTNLLKDYPQLDPFAFTTYPGQAYTSYDGDIMNVGVFYNDAGGVRYAGYRQLALSYVSDLTKPAESLLPAVVATSDIQPTNGVIHVIRQSYPFGDITDLDNILLQEHYFGFDLGIFLTEVTSAGIDSKP